MRASKGELNPPLLSATNEFDKPLPMYPKRTVGMTKTPSDDVPRSSDGIKYVLFDLDETLYPRDAGVMQAIGRRIELYVQEKTGLPPERVSEIRREYLKKYGTTLAGLLRHYPDLVDEKEYQEFVHDIPLEKMVHPDRELARALERIPQKKIVLTNASRAHATRVLRALGVERFFDRIVDIADLGYVNKPRPEAYRRALRILGAEGPECVLVEDNVRNLLPAKALGMVTVLVDAEGAPGVDFVIHKISEIADVMEALESGGRDEAIVHRRTGCRGTSGQTQR